MPRADRPTCSAVPCSIETAAVPTADTVPRTPAGEEENLFFFSNFKTTLLERFEQLEIYIISYPIDRI